jgi:hypothetical protein
MRFSSPSRALPRANPSLRLVRYFIAALAFPWQIAATAAPPTAETAAATKTRTFTHPGLLNSKAELDFIKEKIQAKAEPWQGMFQRLKHSPFGNPAWSPKARRVIDANGKEASQANDDATAAYTLALLWYFTGDDAYAKKSAGILNAWAANLETITSRDQQKELVAAWCGSVFPLAGEILRSSDPKWTKPEIQQFSRMLQKVFLPVLQPGNASFNGNWELAMVNALMAIGVFNADKPTFDRAVALWHQRVPAWLYLKKDGPLPRPPDGAPGLANEAELRKYWFNPPGFSDGLCQETCRDYGHHFQQGMASTINSAEIAWHQGLDLYTGEEKRLTAALEFHAGLLLGEPSPTGSLPAGYQASGLQPTWEIAWHHFHGRRQLPLPLTERLLRTKVRPMDFSSTLNMAWESLTHAGP